MAGDMLQLCHRSVSASGDSPKAQTGHLACSTHPVATPHRAGMHHIAGNHGRVASRGMATHCRIAGNCSWAASLVVWTAWVSLDWQSMCPGTCTADEHVIRGV